MTALALGGNVRLGFEDNVFLHKGVLAKENAELVGRVARLAASGTGDCATPDEARQILRLRPYDDAEGDGPRGRASGRPPRT